MTIESRNPATGVVDQQFTAMDTASVTLAIDRAERAFIDFRRTSFDQRKRWLERAADILDEEAPRLARLATLEMGKTLESAVAEVRKCAKGARYYAQHAEEFLRDSHAHGHEVGAQAAYVRWEPIGVVLAVMPWNYPYWQVMRFAAPALMAGNAVLLKHASNVPQCALAIEDVFLRAGFGEGVLQTLLIEAAQVGAVIDDNRVAAITLTGSEGAGRAVATRAAQSIKKTLLELGGNDPFIVMPSADIEEAVRVGVKSRCINNGQSCASAKRFLVHTDVASQFIDGFVSAMAAVNVGDPMRASTELGPIATEAGRDDIAALISEAVLGGAELLTGGVCVEGDGWYFPPTVVTGTTSSMRIYREEVFGPVAQVFTFSTIEEALAIANDSDLGLSSSIWTDVTSDQDALISGLECGAVYVNGMSVSYPELPFGGVKRSGYGRELADLGMKEFCNAKTVWIA